MKCLKNIYIDVVSYLNRWSQWHEIDDSEIMKNSKQNRLKVTDRVSCEHRVQNTIENLPLYMY